MVLTPVVHIRGSRYRSRWRGCWDRGSWGRLLWRWRRICKLNKHNKGPAEAVYYCFIDVVSSCMRILKQPYPLHYMEWDFQFSLQFPQPTAISPSRPQSPHAWRKVKISPKHTQTNRKKREEEKKGRNKKNQHIPAIWQCVGDGLLQLTHTVRRQEFLFWQIV